MSTLATHSAMLTARSLRTLMRQPAYLIVTLIQPVVWLLLFGALFDKVTQIPGFSNSDTTYVAFLAPGVVMMTALFSAAWAGTVYIEDMNLGVMDRLLASPTSRGAMMNGTLAYQAIVTIVQSLVVFGIAFVAGARYPNATAGLIVSLVAAILLTIIFAALSNAVALLVRQQEALIGISQLLSLPLTFMSSAVMVLALAPQWIQTIAKYNPLNWAVNASRDALTANPDWGSVGANLIALSAVSLVMAVAATRAFGMYQRSL
jgi:ABC-2 type transport system permease protein